MTVCLPPSVSTSSNFLNADALRRLCARMANLGWWVLDLKQQALNLSDEACAIYGIPAGSVLSVQRAASYYVPASRKSLWRHFQEACSEGRSFDTELELITAGRTRAWVRVIGEAERDNNGRVVRIQGAIQDITGWKRAAMENRQQASLLDQARDAINVRDLNNRITYWNRSSERLYGYSAAEACGRSAEELLHAEPDLELALSQVREYGGWTGELRKRSKEGGQVVVESRWTLMLDEDGQPHSILVIDTDVTERKALEEHLLRAQRLDSIGTLAGGIAHDLNNALTPILMAIHMLRDEETDPDRLDTLQTMELSAQRGADMVRQLLSFARGVEGRREPIQVSQLVREVEKIVNDTFYKNVLVSSRLPRQLPPVCGDSTQLHQVLLNLCLNARDAMPNGGSLTLTATSEFVDKERAARHRGARSGRHLCLRVEDTGTGMTAAILNRLFEPFFTTKDQGKGTGLGLCSSLAIVRGHGGFMEVESQPGRGTRVSVYLPEAEGETPPQTASEAVLPRGQGQLILIVDDEDPVCQLTRKILEGHGYRTLTASSGVDALSLYGTHRHEIELVVLDMMMPVLDGPAISQILRAMNPHVKVLAVSGVSGGHAKAEWLHDFVAKPYSRDTLLHAVTRALPPTQ